MIRFLISRIKRRSLERQRAIVWDAFQDSFDKRIEEARAKHAKARFIEKARTDAVHAALRGVR